MTRPDRLAALLLGLALALPAGALAETWEWDGTNWSEISTTGGSDDYSNWLTKDDLLGALLEEVLDISEDLGPSFFEVTTAATFLAFHRIPADACVIEVGLGGRLDAVNAGRGVGCEYTPHVPS